MITTNEFIVNDVSSLKSWDLLKSDKDSYLIDVRTPEEWEEIGIPDLSKINKEVKLVSIMLFAPDIHQNINFINELERNVPKKDAKLIFICKAGGRSLKAAKIASSIGYKNCYNVADGFEGNIFNANHEPLNLNGWINNELPRKSL